MALPTTWLLSENRGFRMTDPSENKLEHEPFSFQVLKNESVQIFYKGKIAATLNRREGRKFVDKVESQSLQERQLLMARATGQFKFGNERLAQNASNSSQSN
jgi:hypothetical protein